LTPVPEHTLASEMQLTEMQLTEVD
jgi:hypothetical protein